MSSGSPPLVKTITKNHRDWIAYIVGVIGIVLAVYFYFFPYTANPKPAFLIDPVRATIVKSSSDMTTLSVSFKGQPITGRDLTALRFYFWNDGPTVLRRSDILQPYSCKLDGNIDILEYRALKVTRDVTKLNMKQVSKDTVGIDFDVLEHGDGLTAQLIFAGPSNAKMNCTGISVSSPKPSIITVPQREESKGLSRVRRFTRVFPWLFLLYFLVVGVYTSWRAYGLYKRASSNQKKAMVVLATLAIFVTLVWFVTYSFRQFRDQLSSVPSPLILSD